MNTRLLRKVAEHIAEEPNRLFMTAGIVSTDELREFDVTMKPPCGTVGCIAGWSLVVKRKNKQRAINHFSEAGWLGTHAAAKRDLRLSESEAMRLFYLSGWPTNLGNAFQTAQTPQQRASVTIARIERFIKTRGKE